MRKATERLRQQEQTFKFQQEELMRAETLRREQSREAWKEISTVRDRTVLLRWHDVALLFRYAHARASAMDSQVSISLVDFDIGVSLISASRPPEGNFHRSIALDTLDYDAYYVRCLPGDECSLCENIL